jgi:hypothetical protein
MTKDILPPSEPVTGPRKQTLTERAKQASDLQPTKKPKTSGILHMVGTVKAMSIEDIEEEEDLRRSPPPPQSQPHSQRS